MVEVTLSCGLAVFNINTAHSMRDLGGVSGMTSSSGTLGCGKFSDNERFDKLGTGRGSANSKTEKPWIKRKSRS